MRGGVVSIRTTADAARATPSAFVASARTSYCPSGSTAPSSPLPSHVIATLFPAPLLALTTSPAASRTLTVQSAARETSNLILVSSRTPSPLGLMAAGPALNA